MMEVRANLSFGAFRQNKTYTVVENEQITALLGVGYLTEVGDGTDNPVLSGAIPGDSVVARDPKSEVGDGEGEPEPRGESPDSKGIHRPAGGQDN